MLMKWLERMERYLAHHGHYFWKERDVELDSHGDSDGTEIKFLIVSYPVIRVGVGNHTLTHLGGRILTNFLGMIFVFGSFESS